MQTYFPGDCKNFARDTCTKANLKLSSLKANEQQTRFSHAYWCPEIRLWETTPFQNRKYGKLVKILPVPNPVGSTYILASATIINSISSKLLCTVCSFQINFLQVSSDQYMLEFKSNLYNFSFMILNINLPRSRFCS